MVRTNQCDGPYFCDFYFDTHFSDFWVVIFATFTETEEIIQSFKR
jgi:hypothetical protein